MDRRLTVFSLVLLFLVVTGALLSRDEPVPPRNDPPVEDVIASTLDSASRLDAPPITLDTTNLAVRGAATALHERQRNRLHETADRLRAHRQLAEEAGASKSVRTLDAHLERVGQRLARLDVAPSQGRRP